MKQGINRKVFKITLFVLSAAMLLFSCAPGQDRSDPVLSTHKYINYESVKDMTENCTVLPPNSSLGSISLR